MRNPISRICAIACSAALAIGIIAVYPAESMDAQSDSTVYVAHDMFFAMDDPTVNRAESEHFQIIWGKNDQSGKINDEFIQGNLYNLENCWDVFMDDLDMIPPSRSIENSDPTDYKTNVYVTRTGLDGFAEGWAFMSASYGYAYIIVDPDAMEYNPPSLVLPHEFGHVVTMHQEAWAGSDISGPWWECTANWFREQYLYSDKYEYMGRKVEKTTDFFEPYLRNLSFTFPHGRNYYQSWTFLQYLTENPDNYDHYGMDFLKRIMCEANRNEYPFDTVARLAPGVSLKDTLGNYAKRMATLDFKEKTLYNQKLNELLANDYYWQLIYTQLEATNNSEWVKVPDERAPMQAGINLIPLNVNSGATSISASLRGLTDAAGADWRACIVAEGADGQTRYSSLFGKDGSATLALNGNESEVYLTVIATPDTMVSTSAFYKESSAPYTTSADDTRYPYEIKLTGAVSNIRPVGRSAQGSPHSNGGGFVASGARVDASVYVGPNACVLGTATVSGNARIEDYAIVSGSAKVSGNAVISGFAMVTSTSWWQSPTVTDNAIVSDYAVVGGASQISGSARVLESAYLIDNTTVSGNGVAKGISFCYGTCSISGAGIADGDYADDTNVTKGATYGWLEGQTYADSRTTTQGIYAKYDFSRQSNSVVYNSNSATNAVLRGNPTNVTSIGGASNAYAFTDPNTFIELDDSLIRMNNIEIRTAVAWAGGSANQKLFSFGSSDESNMYFTPSNADGVAEFKISDGSNNFSLKADSALAIGQWSVIRLIFSDGNVSLSIDDRVVATGTTSIKPADVLGASTENICYIGGSFTGLVDYFSTYYEAGAAPMESYTTIPSDEFNSLFEVISGIKGDVNSDGLVNALDAALLSRHLLGITYLTDVNLVNADVNSDGQVSDADLKLLKEFVLGKVTSF